ncbi:heterogeneous nuclear ribonucleoprotein C-like, partial [Passer montanus]|uniref:heterogeneous nuclear ribonucleoprotein C-like n=1 Tax=Passer montanus TaxID=9160 RepID=UPI0019602ED8
MAAPMSQSQDGRPWSKMAAVPCPSLKGDDLQSIKKELGQIKAKVDALLESLERLEREQKAKGDKAEEEPGASGSKKDEAGGAKAEGGHEDSAEEGDLLDDDEAEERGDEQPESLKGTSMDQYGPVWTSMDCMGQSESGDGTRGPRNEKVCGTSINQYGPVRTDTNQYGP